jgi:hypothetical protein
VRIDAARERVLVGYGVGALAILDPAARTKVGEIRLKAHPESFEIDGDRVFVNVPDARLIEVADLAKSEVVGSRPTQPNHSNFPMAIEREAHRLFVVFRSPARLAVMSAADGSAVGSLDTCGDADDVFADTKRHRVYVTCGAGVIDVFGDHAGSYQADGSDSDCIWRADLAVHSRDGSPVRCGSRIRERTCRDLGISPRLMSSIV